MAQIEFLDETMRDGQQSLWGMRMQAGMALPIAPVIDRVGYRVVDLTGSSLFEVLIRHCREKEFGAEVAGAIMFTLSSGATRGRGSTS